MRRLPVALLTGFLIVAALLPAAAAASPQGAAIAQLNDIRQAHGLQPLRSSGALERSSSRYARHMIRTDYFGHASRIAVSSQFGHAGETLAMQSGWRADPAQTIADWMNSPGHRAVLLSAGYRWIGMGTARGRIGSRLVTVWVAHVGAR
ncbi:MAG: hypothetical protein QOK00_346 [Thermoleophilaceae bacterium]|nr:hypothetical protein [Thermoleophilaceae bacterium]